jgi:hypothetical protein
MFLERVEVDAGIRRGRHVYPVRLFEAVAGLVETRTEHLDVAAYPAHRLLRHAAGIGEVSLIAHVRSQFTQVRPDLFVFTAKVALKKAHAG